MPTPAKSKRRGKRSPHVSAHATLNAGRIRASMRAQLAAALRSLQAQSPTDAEVHAARKCIKRARASLRLLRDALGRAAYQRENVALRDAARPLSATRDARILLDVLDSMTRKSALKPDSAGKLRETMNRHRGQLKRRALVRREIVIARRTLRSVDRRVARWAFTGPDDASIVHALRRVYARARRAMAQAQDDPRAPVLHEWRKQVKYLWHQLQILAPEGSQMARRAEIAHEIADHLGDDHDLAVLQEYALAKRALLSRAAAKALTLQTEKRRLALQKKAFALGRGLFAPGPKSFVADFLRQA